MGTQQLSPTRPGEDLAFVTDKMVLSVALDGDLKNALQASTEGSHYISDTEVENLFKESTQLLRQAGFEIRQQPSGEYFCIKSGEPVSKANALATLASDGGMPFYKLLGKILLEQPATSSSPPKQTVEPTISESSSAKPQSENGAAETNETRDVAKISLKRARSPSSETPKAPKIGVKPDKENPDLTSKPTNRVPTQLKTGEEASTASSDSADVASTASSSDGKDSDSSFTEDSARKDLASGKRSSTFTKPGRTRASTVSSVSSTRSMRSVVRRGSKDREFPEYFDLEERPFAFRHAFKFLKDAKRWQNLPGKGLNTWIYVRGDLTTGGTARGARSGVHGVDYFESEDEVLKYMVKDLTLMEEFTNYRDESSAAVQSSSRRRSRTVPPRANSSQGATQTNLIGRGSLGLETGKKLAAGTLEKENENETIASYEDKVVSIPPFQHSPPSKLHGTLPEKNSKPEVHSSLLNTNGVGFGPWLEFDDSDHYDDDEEDSNDMALKDGGNESAMLVKQLKHNGGPVQTGDTIKEHDRNYEHSLVEGESRTAFLQKYRFLLLGPCPEEVAKVVKSLVGSTFVDWRNLSTGEPLRGVKRLRNSFLVLCSPTTLVSFGALTFLAMGIPLFHYNFVLDFARENLNLKLKQYQLPAGPAFHEGLFWRFANRSLSDGPLCEDERVFCNLKVSVEPYYGSKSIVKLLRQAGAKAGYDLKPSSADLVVCSADCGKSCLSSVLARAGTTPVATYEYVFHSIAAGQRLDIQKLKDNALFSITNTIKRNLEQPDAPAPSTRLVPQPTFASQDLESPLILSTALMRVPSKTFVFLRDGACKRRVFIAKFLHLQSFRGAIFGVFQRCDFDLLSSRVLDIVEENEFITTSPDDVLGIVPVVQRDQLEARYPGSTLAPSIALYNEADINLLDYVFSV